ncbi:MAG: hypothetical protein D6784_14990 [Chloroflexi bacterium]|nr:MAG: hypothetical protein D6784_14990 [Chloroflexota bacterium]
MMNWTPSSPISRQQLASLLLLRLQKTNPTEHQPDLLTWTIIYRRNLGPGKRLDFARHPYLVDLYRETARRVVVYKASQVGASEYLVSYALHACDRRQATVLYVFPTDAHVSDFSSARFGPAIEASDYLDAIIVEGRQKAADTARPRGADRVTLKRVRDRFIYFRGGRVGKDGQAAQLKSIDADVLILDELDEMDPRAPVIARKRLGASRLAEERLVSTPTYPGRGIHAEWLESDQRERFIPCQACGERQVLTINHIVTEWDNLGRPVAWHGGPETAWAACQKCGRRLNPLAGGQWVATRPGREVVGYHLTRLCSPAADLLEIVQNLHTTDETKRREVYNQDLGEPYVPRGGRLTEEILDDCRRDYAHLPLPGEAPVMGVDVGKVLHVVIRGPRHPETGETPQRFAGEVDSFEELGRLMRRYNVRRAVMDALPETTKAREFQAAWPPGTVWLAYYVGQRTGTRRVEPAQWDGANGVVNLDRTRTLDRTMSRFYDRLNTLPAYARDLKDYYAHLTALVRVLEDGPDGQAVARYVETGPDHLAHAENYCTVAMSAPGPAAVATASRAVNLRI